MWLAKDKSDTSENGGARVALKKVKMDNEKEGFPITAIRQGLPNTRRLVSPSVRVRRRAASGLHPPHAGRASSHIHRLSFPFVIREIKILKNLKHDNIVRLKEIVTSKAGDHNKQTGSVFMVFEYAEHDLAGLILSPRIRLEKQHVKSYLKQLLDGLHYLHKQKIL